MNNEEPPNDTRSERSILSSMIKKPGVFLAKAKSENLTPRSFYLPSHQIAYRLLLDMDEAGSDINPESFENLVHKRDLMEKLGGPGQLFEIVESSTFHRNFDEYLGNVREEYAKRKAIEVARNCSQIASDAISSENAIEALQEGAEAVRGILAQKKAFADAEESHKRFLKVMMERAEGGLLPGLETGIPNIDEIGGGMRKGELWVISGKTSGGKSALSYQMSLPAIEQGKKVLIYTLEMGVEEVFGRLISARGRVNMGAIMKPKGITKGEGIKIRDNAKFLSQSRLLITDEANMSIDYICGQAEAEAESGDVGLVIVDYIQLIGGGPSKGESREQELSRISKRLKQLAKKLKCPVITPAQLNDDGRLRESRAIGQDADVVLKITDKGVTVDKFRNAPRFQDLPLALRGEFQRFEHENTFHRNHR